jgi:hypothetical protein
MHGNGATSKRPDCLLTTAKFWKMTKILENADKIITLYFFINKALKMPKIVAKCSQTYYVILFL